MENSIDIKKLAKCAMLNLEKDGAEGMQAAVEKSVESCGVLAEVFEKGSVEHLTVAGGTYNICGTGGTYNISGTDGTYNICGTGGINGTDGGTGESAGAAVLRSDEPCEADSAAAQRILKAAPETYENCIAVPRVVE